VSPAEYNFTKEIYKLNFSLWRYFPTEPNTLYSIHTHLIVHYIEPVHLQAIVTSQFRLQFRVSCYECLKFTSRFPLNMYIL